MTKPGEHADPHGDLAEHGSEHSFASVLPSGQDVPRAAGQSSCGEAHSCEEDVPVLIVGGGVAGLVAARAVLETGGRVTVLERTPRFGGNASKAACGISAAVTAAQKAQGVEDSVEKFIDDVSRDARRGTRLARALCENSGRDVDWVAALPGLELSGIEQLRGHSEPRTHHFREQETGSALVRALMRDIERASQESNRVRTITGAQVTRLLVDSRGCCGCVYRLNGAEEMALGPVVLCTGGFTTNHARDSLLAQHRPDLLHLPVSGRYSLGDGLRLASAARARTADLNWIHVSPFGLVKSDDPEANAKLAAPEALREAGALILNPEGCRICDERAGEAEVVCAMWSSKAPFRLVLSAAAAPACVQLCDHYVTLGVMRLFQSGVALAKEMGVPLSTLEATFEAHHASGSCHAAVPGAAVADQRFYVAVVTPVLQCCLGGLVVHTNGAVLDGEDREVHGLFAAGEVACGISGSNCLAGLPLLECLVLGRAAGRAAAEAALAWDRGEPEVGISEPASASDEPVEVETPPVAETPSKEPGSPLKVMQDVRRQSAALQLESFLRSRLTAGLLRTALAKAHACGGDPEVVQEFLRSAILGEVDAEQTRPQLHLSLKANSRLRPAVATAPLPDVGGTSTKVPLSCVYCRNRLTAEVYRDADVEANPTVNDVRGPFAYTTLLYGAKFEYFLGALVLGWSLKNTGTAIDLLLLHSDDVPGAFLEVLARFWTLRQVEYLEGNKAMYKKYHESRFKAVFTKLQALSCTDYTKVLMLDLDMLVRGSLDELFELRAPAALKRSSGREQPEHGGTYGAKDMWRAQRDDMCSGINAGIMLLEPDQRVYERMVAEITDPRHPEHIGSYGPEQDYLARFYSVFLTGSWTHIHAKFNYQLMLPDDYCSSAHKAVDIEKDVVVAHYSGPRVKPWKLGGRDLDADGIARLLHDDTVRELFGRDHWAAARDQRGSNGNGYRQQSRDRVMDGVLVKELDSGAGKVPAAVQAVMWEWVLALRTCVKSLEEDGVDVLSLVRGMQRTSR